MAVTTTARRVLATGAIAGTALLALALPASAHTPHLNANCGDAHTTLHVNLQAYNAKKDNTVKATDGDTVLVDKTFKSSFDQTFEVSNTEDHTFTVTVGAWDDPDSSHGFSFTKTIKVAACAEAPTTPPAKTETTTPATTTPATTTSNEAPVPPATTPAPPAAQGGDLPNTGASVALPLGIGAVLLLGGGALLFVVYKRRAA